MFYHKTMTGNMAVFTVSSFFQRIFGLRGSTTLTLSGGSYAGKIVEGDTALQLSTVFACVRLISQSIASLPCGLFSLDADGDKVLLKDNPLYKLLRSRPNANMTAVDFWRAVVASLLLWGNSYNLKTYSGKRLIAVEPLPTENMSIRLNKDGSATYLFNDYTGLKEYPEDMILHFKGFGVSGRAGLSVISFARQSFGNALAQDETMGRLYSNGMRPGGALTIPNVLKEGQREEVRTNIADQISGVAKGGGTIILEGGMKYESLSIPPEDAQMIQTKSFSVEEICRWFGVPPVMIGHSNGVTTWGSGIEQLNIGFLTYTLQPIYQALEEELNRSAVPITERDDVFAEFDTKNFLRADSTGRAALYSSGAQNGWLTRAEIRRRESLPYLEGSDTLTVQSALVNLDALGAMPAPAPDTVKPIEDVTKV